jgi:hypothetical protein
MSRNLILNYCQNFTNPNPVSLTVRGVGDITRTERIVGVAIAEVRERFPVDGVLRVRAAAVTQDVRLVARLVARLQRRMGD